MTDVPYLSYVAFYILSFHVLQSNSRTSTVWKLNIEDGKIVDGNVVDPVLSGPEGKEDPAFNIITSTIHYGRSWVKRSKENLHENCQVTCSERRKR